MKSLFTTVVVLTLFVLMVIGCFGCGEKKEPKLVVTVDNPIVYDTVENVVNDSAFLVTKFRKHFNIDSSWGRPKSKDEILTEKLDIIIMLLKQINNKK